MYGVTVKTKYCPNIYCASHYYMYYLHGQLCHTCNTCLVFLDVVHVLNIYSTHILAKLVLHLYIYLGLYTVSKVIDSIGIIKSLLIWVSE